MKYFMPLLQRNADSVKMLLKLSLKLLQKLGSMCTERCKVTVALVNVRHVEILLFTHRRQQTSYMSVTVRDIKIKLFKESDNRTVLRLENVMFHRNSTCNYHEKSFHENSMEYFTRNVTESHGVSTENFICLYVLAHMEFLEV